MSHGMYDFLGAGVHIDDLNVSALIYSYADDIIMYWLLFLKRELSTQ